MVRDKVNDELHSAPVVTVMILPLEDDEIEAFPVILQEYVLIPTGAE